MDEFSWVYLFLSGIGLAVISLVIGVAARRIFRLEPLTSGFSSTSILVLGWMIPAVGYSLFKTLGNTSSVILLVYLLAFWTYSRFRGQVKLKRPEQRPWISEGRKLAILVGIYAILMIASNFYAVRGNWSRMPFPVGDMEAYSQMISHLSFFGEEYSSLDWFSPEYHRNAPYHYLELWFSALWAEVFHIPPGLQLICLSIPYFLTTVVIAAYETCGQMKLGKITSIIGGVLFMFVGAWGFLYPDLGILSGEVWNLSALMYLKLLPIYPLFIVIGYSLYAKRSAIGILFLIGLIGFSFNTLLPAAGLVYIAFGIWVIYVGERRITKLMVPASVFFGCCILWLSFYLLQDSGGAEASRIISASQEVNVFSLDYIKTAINVIGKTSIQIIIIIFPFALIWWYGYRQKAFHTRYELFFGAALIFFFVPLLAWAVLHPMTDSVQLWGIFFMPSVNVFMFISMLVWFRLKGRFRWIGITVMAITVISHPIYRLDAQSVEEEGFEGLKLGFNRPLRVGYLVKNRPIDNYFDTYTQVFTPASWLVSYANPIQITCLNPWSVLEDYRGPKARSVSENIKLTSIKIFEERNALQKSSREKLQKDFIDYYRLDGIIVNSSDTASYSHLIEKYPFNHQLQHDWVLYYDSR